MSVFRTNASFIHGALAAEQAGEEGGRKAHSNPQTTVSAVSDTCITFHGGGGGGGHCHLLDLHVHVHVILRPHYSVW